jgi:hypothetical protein
LNSNRYENSDDLLFPSADSKLTIENNKLNKDELKKQLNELSVKIKDYENN